ncbi:radical SAM/SPASM domain-containing protein [Bergeyella sp. RCAD1439]|uniref:radical SAM/SPASM domain-containing protein n=1 Tax=Bergeyella anatis TaxID=3113737 RepID=UPI002E19EE2E|nr:radical SAM protein [Bergeyella sp. RCAD1439]
MKSSYYNIFFKKEDKFIGYNTVTDKYIVLEPLLYELFEASIFEKNITQLKDIHETFYDVLFKNGFIVSTDKNELDEIKKISDSTDFNDEYFMLTINSTMNCNFKCWYCYETHIKDSRLDEIVSKKIILFIKNLLDNKTKIKNLNIQWFGGEPLLYFNKSILPILGEIDSICKKREVILSNGFTTNGLLITQKILNDCKKYLVDHFQITLDGHRDRHNKVRNISKTKGSYDEIVENIKLCVKNEFNVTVRINISEETVNDLLQIINDFKDLSSVEKSYIIFSFHEVWQEEKDLTFDISNFVEEFRNNKFKCVSKSDNLAGIYNSCYADKANQAVINYNGDVYKCTARDFKKEDKEGILSDSGEIVWNEKLTKRLYETRFKNKPCLECKILPLCNGGCSQHRIENENNDYCMFNFDENQKIEIVKERFKSKLELSLPTDHGNPIINSFLNIPYPNNSDKSNVFFQQSLENLFNDKVRIENRNLVNTINNHYIDGLIELRNNNFDKHHEITDYIFTIQKESQFNEDEKNVIRLLSLPAIAYYYYKIKDYHKAINITNESILVDDQFLNSYPFLYSHKIQQLHNLIRVFFKNNNIDEALKLCNDVLSHLVLGKNVEYEVGFWSNDMLASDELIGMTFQIFGEVVSYILNFSRNSTEELDFYMIAFRDLIKSSDKVNDRYNIIKEFLTIKTDIENHKNDLSRILCLKNDITNSQFYYMIFPLLKSLFSSIGKNSFIDNRSEFNRIQRQYALN